MRENVAWDARIASCDPNIADLGKMEPSRGLSLSRTHDKETQNSRLGKLLTPSRFLLAHVKTKFFPRLSLAQSPILELEKVILFDQSEARDDQSEAPDDFINSAGLTVASQMSIS